MMPERPPLSTDPGPSAPSPDRTQAALDFSSDIVSVVDEEGRLVHSSTVARRLLGFEPAEIEGRSSFDLVHPEDVGLLRRTFEHWLAHPGTPVRVEYRSARKDGSWLWVEAVGVNHLDNPAIRGIVVSARDISDRKQVERELTRRARHRDFLERIDRIALASASLEGFLEGVLGEILVIFEADRAWLLSPCDPEAPSWTVPMECTRPEWPGVYQRGLLMPMTPAVAEVFRLLLTSEEPVSFGPGTPRSLEGDEVAGRFSVRSMVQMALRPRLGSSWSFGLHHCAEPRRYSEDDLLLFKAVGLRVSEALSGLITLKRLRESEERYRTLVENLPVGVVVLAPDSSVLLSNPMARLLLGVSEAQLHSRTVADPGWHFLREDGTRMPPEEHPVTAVLSKGEQIQQVVLGVCRPDFAEPAWVLCNAYPVRDAQRTVQVVLTLHDITERRKAVQALQETTEMFSRFMQRSPVYAFIKEVTPTESRVLQASDNYDRMIGIPARDMIGKTMAELFPPEFAAKITADDWTVASRGEVLDLDEELHGRSYSTIKFPIVVGERVLLAGYTIDITARKQMEEALRQSQKLESLGVLAGGIAHDFNNLLTAILGNLNLAQLKLRPESPAHPNLEAAEKTVLKASDLTRQMLAYSGRGRFVVKPHDLNEVVEEMSHLLRVSISKKTSLRLNLTPDPPQIEGDSAQIQQVMMNLVTNAADAIGDDDGCISITTRVEDLDATLIDRILPNQPLLPGRHATLEVGDTGCGIPPEVLPKIFDPFFSTKATGRGLGLSAMLGILRGHGAGIRINTEVGKGTTFKIYFPMRAAQGRRQAPESTRDREQAPLRGLVLVVDDEPIVLQFLEGAVSALGMEVITARDGQEAVERFQAEARRIDLVLMDLTMPRMDGKQAFLELRKLRPDLRVILSSGYDERESIQHSLGSALAGFIPKPYQLSELREAIAAALES